MVEEIYEGLGVLNEGVVRAHRKGYKVIDGVVYSPVDGGVIKTVPNSQGYLCFTIQHGVAKFTVLVHKLVAYQKYGKRLFVKGIVVRHLDGNNQNNRRENIKIGTYRDNSLDVPEHKRLAIAINASEKIRRFTDEEMVKIRQRYQETRSYKKVMEEFKITSKAVLHRILNVDYVTKK